jgi:cystathionine beta-lyase
MTKITASLFDDAPDRRKSGSYKWDSCPDRELIPLWVADMDFRTAPCVVDALQQRVSHGVFGYTLVDDDYYRALTNWFEQRHGGYHIDRERVIYTSGVVPAISAIIKALAKPGEGVIVQTPVYNCFFSSIRNNGCRIVESPLKRVDLSPTEFTYKMDFDDLRRKAADPNNTVLLLCNPHNPAGRIWSREELVEVATICSEYGVRVISDEIHCELTMPGRSYTPYGLVDPTGVVCLSPSKAFNTAGLQIANIVCPDEEVRCKVDRAININEVCDVNPFGVVALKAAYSEAGAEWLDALRSYLFENYEATRRFLTEQLPGCPIATLEATYLPWVDVRRFGIPTEQLEEQLKEVAKVWVNCGEMYGADGYIRLNIACPRERLMEGLRRIVEFLNGKDGRD